MKINEKNGSDLKPASWATDDDISKTTDDGDIRRTDDTEHTLDVIIVEDDVTKIADDVIGKVTVCIVGGVDKTNVADDTIGNCSAVDVDDVNSAVSRSVDIIGDEQMDTRKG